MVVKDRSSEYGYEVLQKWYTIKYLDFGVTQSYTCNKITLM